MCHFITMVVPPKADIERVIAVLGRHHRGFEAVENRHLAKLLRPGELYFWPEHGHCDCGTALGSAAVAAEQGYSAHVEKLRRKGWGAKKIERWLDEKIKKERADADKMQRRLASEDDPDGWVTLLRGLRSNASLPYVGILLHWYSGGLSERIDAERQSVPLDDDIGSQLLMMEEDVLYIVT